MERKSIYIDNMGVPITYGNLTNDDLLNIIAMCELILGIRHEKETKKEA